MHIGHIGRESSHLGRLRAFNGFTNQVKIFFVQLLVFFTFLAPLALLFPPRNFLIVIVFLFVIIIYEAFADLQRKDSG